MWIDLLVLLHQEIFTHFNLGETSMADVIPYLDTIRHITTDIAEILSILSVVAVTLSRLKNWLKPSK